MKLSDLIQKIISTLLLKAIYFHIRISRKLLFWTTRFEVNKRKHKILIMAIYQNIKVCEKFTWYFEMDVEKK